MALDVITILAQYWLHCITMVSVQHVIESLELELPTHIPGCPATPTLLINAIFGTRP